VKTMIGLKAVLVSLLKEAKNKIRSAYPGVNAWARERSPTVTAWAREICRLQR